MLKHKLVAAGLLGAVALPGMAVAQDSMPTLPISANLTFTSDYVFRGQSQTNENFAVQGGFDYAHEATGLYVGTWASNVSFAPGSVELDAYAGWTKSFGDFGVDVGYIHYDYPENGALNTDEIYLGGSWKWFTAKYYYTVSDDAFGVVDGQGTQYFTVGASYQFPIGVTVAGSYGMTRYDGEATPGSPNDFGDYDDYKVSVGYTYSGLDFAVAYTDTSFDNSAAKDAIGKIADDRVFVSVTKKF